MSADEENRKELDDMSRLLTDAILRIRRLEEEVAALRRQVPDQR